MELKQFVPSNYCLKCVGCCRFLENPTIWAPQGFRLVKTNDGYRCEHLKEKNNRCAMYPQRPLDCRMYPFLLVRKGGNLHLGLHKSCCFVEEKQPAAADIQAYAQYLKNRLNTASLISAISENPEIAADYQENVELITDLKDIFAKAYLPKLNKLTLKDKPRIEGYLLKYKTRLSAYHFADIFIWKDLFQIFWLIIEDELCVFYRDAIGMFMMLPPLGKFKPAVVMKCFEIMNAYNSDSPVSRIENASREDIAKYSRLGLSSKLKDSEYLCLRKDLIELAGKGFKSKRSSCNYFVKNYRADFLEYKDS
ncbi:MAG: phosphatidylglycerol lysyltransferase domain-containing protein, partial [Candidatus Omnitrophota bacterium]